MKIIDATILTRRHGSDLVWLKTDLPDTTWPYKEVLVLRFEVAKGMGRDYVEQHFAGLKIHEVSEE